MDRPVLEPHQELSAVRVHGAWVASSSITTWEELTDDSKNGDGNKVSEIIVFGTPVDHLPQLPYVSLHPRATSQLPVSISTSNDHHKLSTE